MIVMKKLLFTGGSGFLGRNTIPTLNKSYEVTTLGITDYDDIKTNLAKTVPQLSVKYDVILHAAGKAHIYPKTEEERRAFYDVNYEGTKNLCKALENNLPEAIVFISTMSVYGSEPGNMDTETSRPLIGDTPYADSKIKAEQYLTNWCHDHGVTLGILRPGLIAGENAPGNLGAMVRGIKKGAYLSINHGKARKSMLMAQDIARLVPLVVEKGGVYNVCDSHNPSFGELETIISAQLGKRKPISIPYWMAKCIALIGDALGNWFPLNSSRLQKIVTSDTYSNAKARKKLGWEPLPVIDNYKI